MQEQQEQKNLISWHYLILPKIGSQVFIERVSKNKQKTNKNIKKILDFLAKMQYTACNDASDQSVSEGGQFRTPDIILIYQVLSKFYRSFDFYICFSSQW